MVKKKKVVKPLISVIVPVYNSEKTLKIFLNSLFKNDYPNFEVIIVDDCSTDSSLEIASEYKVKIVQQNKNQGPAMARNKGAQHAKGKYLFFIDSDTQLYQNTLSTLYETFKNDKRIDVVCGVYTKKSLNPGFFQDYYCLLKHYSHTYKEITKYETFTGQVAGAKKDVFMAVNGYKNIPFGLDIENEELGSRLYKKYYMIINPKLQVDHHYAGFRKLSRLLFKRTFCWMKLFMTIKRFEQALTTKSFGIGTTMGPISLFFFFGALLGFYLPTNYLIPLISLNLAIIFLYAFLGAYGGFLRLTYKEKGFSFMLKSLLASLYFSVLISGGAFYAVLHRKIINLMGNKDAVQKLF